MSGLDFGLYHQPPGIGEESGHYLSELGYTEDEQAQLAAEGVVITSKRLR